MYFHIIFLRHHQSSSDLGKNDLTGSLNRSNSSCLLQIPTKLSKARYYLRNQLLKFKTLQRSSKLQWASLSIRVCLGLYPVPQITRKLTDNNKNTGNTLWNLSDNTSKRGDAASLSQSPIIYGWGGSQTKFYNFGISTSLLRVPS